MENDARVVGPDAPTANSKIVKLDIAAAEWSPPNEMGDQAAESALIVT